MKLVISPKFYFLLALLSPLILSGCTGGFKSSEETLSKASSATSNPWSQATISSLPEQSSFANSAAAYCSIYVPAIISRDQELRIVVMSRGIVQFQVSVNGSDFFNLQTVNGSLSWAGNLFDAGNYHLKFRGLLANNNRLDCDPASKTLMISESSNSAIPVPTIPTPAPIPGPTTPTPSPTTPPSSDTGAPTSGEALIDKSYAPLVGVNGGFRGFKDEYNPSKLVKVEVDPSFAPGEKCYQLPTRHWPEVLRTLSSTKYRIFIPPGTKSFYMTALTYYDATTVQALSMKLNSAPTVSYEYVLASHPSSNMGRDALENLFSGAQVHGFLGPNANVMPGFPGKGTGTDHSVRYIYKTPKGGWLYINHLRIIGGVSMLMTTSSCVDIADYQNWYQNAQWDSDGNPL